MPVYTPPTAGSTISQLYTQINAALEALAGSQSGPDEPTIKPTNSLWADTATGWYRRWTGSAWVNLLPIGTSPALVASGAVAMTGALAMGGQKITGLAAGTTGTDAVSKSQMDTAIAAGVAGATVVDASSTYGVTVEPNLANNQLLGLVSTTSEAVLISFTFGGTVKDAALGVTVPVEAVRRWVLAGEPEQLVLEVLNSGSLRLRVWVRHTGTLVQARTEISGTTAPFTLTVVGTYKAMTF